MQFLRFTTALLLTIGTNQLLIQSDNAFIAAVIVFIFCMLITRSVGASAEAQKPIKRSRYIPKEVRREVWRRDEGRCVECGSNEFLEFDYFVPVTRGLRETFDWFVKPVIAKSDRHLIGRLDDHGSSCYDTCGIRVK